ncbi:MAG: type II toxin-antitoxin system Phd/YefM family antitoxin [Acidobacteriota bacterium]
MAIKEDIRSVTYLKAKAADLLVQVNETHRPVIITQNGQARAVLQDPETFERMRMAIGLLKLLSQGEEDARQGRLTSHDEVFRKLRAKLQGGRATEARRVARGRRDAR